MKLQTVKSLSLGRIAGHKNTMSDLSSLEKKELIDLVQFYMSIIGMFMRVE